MLPGDKGLLSLPLSVISLLVVVIIIFEASVFPRTVSLLRPVTVVVTVAVAVVVGGVTVVVSLSGSGPGPRSGSTRASYADPPQVAGLPEASLPLLPLPLSVPRFGEFRSEAVRGEAPVPAVVAVSGPGPRSRPGSRPGPGAGSGSPGPGAARLRAGAIRMRHH